MVEKELVASAARTTNGNSGPVDSLSGIDKLQPTRASSARIILDCTAASGTTPSLDVDIRGVVKGRTVTIASFAQLAGVGSETILVEACPETIQIDWGIAGGSPSFTFSVDCVR